MKTALEYYGLIKASDNMSQVLTDIRSWLDGIDDNPFDAEKLWSCHVICRVVAKRWQLEQLGWGLRDGLFARHYNHTWLYREGLILDVYPVASFGGPLIVDVNSSMWSPWKYLYSEFGIDTGDIDKQVKWLEQRRP